MISRKMRAESSASMSSRLASPDLQEVSQQVVPVPGQDRLGVKLHPEHRPTGVAHPHQLVLGRARDRDQELGQRVLDHDQAVIASRVVGRRDAREHTRAVVHDRRELAVHDPLGLYHLRAVHLAQGLMAETHPEGGDVEVGHHAPAKRLAHPAVFGPPRSGREQ
jgi:hypothetical protein